MVMLTLQFCCSARCVAARLTGDIGALVTVSDFCSGRIEISIFIRWRTLGVLLTMLLVIFTSCIGVSLVKTGHEELYADAGEAGA